MCWHYEKDFYNEPTEFDIAMKELKTKLMNSVKEEFLNEMNQLRKENEELQYVKQNLEEIKRDYERKKRELEREYQQRKAEVRKERLIELMKDYKTILYGVDVKIERPPKCDKCDKNRRIRFITPLGREAYEDCTCKEEKKVYFPEECVLYEFRLNRDGHEVVARYRPYSDDEDSFLYYNSIRADCIYSPEMKFEEIDKYRTLFKTKEECQKYCDWLNSQ